MPPPPLPPSDRWSDLQQAFDFARRRFQEWADDEMIRPTQLELILYAYDTQCSKWAAAREQGELPPDRSGLTEADPGETPQDRSWRNWVFLGHEIRRLANLGHFSLAQSHDLLAEAQEREAALDHLSGSSGRRRQSAARPPRAPDSPLDTLWAGRKARDASRPAGEPQPAPPPGEPRRSLLDMLLDPRNIQMLLAFGGALMVVGLVILLWVNEFFSPPVVAVSLGVGNAALLAAGWWLLRSTRYQLAGRALTLLACLVMPLNLWYYHANQLVTLDGHLWVAALAISALYAASALVLRDTLFVYIFIAGVTLTGLLVLADIPPSPHKLLETAAPATLLVVLGLLAIHAERAFPPQDDGPFGRQRFGLAFFWSGHALLAAGLLLVLGAQVAGDWLYQPVFERVYQRLDTTPSPIVGDLRWLALALVVAGTYAYVYSDLVVRHVGVYVHIAAGTLLWALLLGLQMLNLALGMDALIAALAVTALAVNGAQATVFRDSRYTRSLPILGVLLPLVAVGLGLLVYGRAVSPDLKAVWPGSSPAWSYVGAMLLTAVACRAGAHAYRHSHPRLSAVYFFATAAATLVGATALLAVLGLNTWRENAPLLMLVPIGYVVAARLYRGQPAERPLLWVAHTATIALLVASLASAVEGFALVREQPLNLILALFFAEAAVFYGLAVGFYRQVWAIHLGAATACGAVWQVLDYAGVTAEFYTLTFALVGVGLLVAYRFAVLERFAAGPVADAAFRSANTLLSLSFVAALFLGLSRIAGHHVQWTLVGLFALLTAVALGAVGLVRHRAWRRWYVVMAVGQAALAFFGTTVLSDLHPLQKLEIFCVTVGLLMLMAGHVGWYREQDRHSDLVSVSLFLGSLLVGMPLAVATLVDRSQNDFIALNDLGFLAAGVLLLTTGFLFRLKSTALTGAGLTALYFLTLLLFVPWGRLNTLAIFITVGGGLLFGTGLLLSVYRDRLLVLPEKVRRREGVFRILNWR